MTDLLWAVEGALRHTMLGEAMRGSRWLWPICESLHFIGMALLVGTVGLFDLRLIGVVSRVPVAAMHRLIPLGVAGFGINVLTGVCFLCGDPDQYLFNNAFRIKMALMLVAGVNVMAFYGRVFRRLDDAPSGAVVPPAARLVGAISLTCWISVMAAGRLITFFRPLF